MTVMRLCGPTAAAGIQLHSKFGGKTVQLSYGNATALIITNGTDTNECLDCKIKRESERESQTDRAKPIIIVPRKINNGDDVSSKPEIPKCEPRPS